MKDKKLLIIILICIIFIISNKILLSVDWSSPIRISSGSTPDLDIDPITGYLHIISMSSSGVTYTKMNQSGSILQQELVPGSGYDRGGFRFGASVSVDKDGKPYVCYRVLQHDDVYDGYYTYRNSTGWSSSVKVFNDVARGYVFRIDFDSNNRAHIAHGSKEENVWGPVTYYRLVNGQLAKKKTGMTKYRADDRIEIDSGPGNNVHLILGCPDSNGGPVTYWRSTNGGDSWSKTGDIHHANAGGRNGSPDLFIDKNNVAHICYGSSQDASRGGTPSARYARYKNGSKIRDLAITSQGELTTWHHGGGIASVAASDDGGHVVIAYQKTDGGALYARESNDGGAHWSSAVRLASSCGGSESRDKQFIRAKNNKFYLVYPSSGSVYLRILQATQQSETVSAPNKPTGPSNGDVGENLTFGTGGSTSSKGNEVEYQFDWGDGTQSSWGGTSKSKGYNSSGLFNIKARARSKPNPDVISNWSDSYQVNISGGEYVTEPNAPEGPTNGDSGQSLNFSTGGSTSSQGNEVEYQFDWGDGTQSSWGGTSRSKSYNSTGLYNIKARARSKPNPDVISNWSNIHTVDITVQSTTYTLSVSTFPTGAGRVNKNPDKTNYAENETVQLTATVNVGDDIYLEAESGTLSGPVAIGNNSEASGSQYIYGTSSQPKAAHVEYDFQIQESGSYIIWGRCYALSGGEDSFFVVADGSSDTLTWHLETEYNNWRWQKVSDSHVVKEFTFNEGAHSLSLITRDINARIDKLIITKKQNFQPTGKGEDPASKIYRFDHWSGDLTGSSNPTTLVMNNNKSITANFVETNEVVSIPTIVNSPTSGIIGCTIDFSAEGAVSDLGHNVEYQFDWGDGSQSIWGTSTQAHTFTSLDIFQIKTRARCAIHTQIVSEWSDNHTISIEDSIFYSLSVDVLPQNAGLVNINPNKERILSNETVELTAISFKGNGIKDGNVHIEAETATLYEPFVVSVDANASQEKYISAPTGDSNPTGNPSNGRAEYSFSITDPGNYLIWGRIYAPSGGEDTFFFVVDADPDTLLWDIERPYNVWRWMKFKDRQLGEFRKYLAAGTHSLTLIKREVNTKIDKIIITKDLNFQPEGLEELPPEGVSYNFDHWSGDLSGINNPATLIIDSDKNITAHFIIDGSETVSTPLIPDGPSSCLIGQQINIRASGAVSDLGHEVEYQFDWGDGNSSFWGESERNYTYSMTGIYNIKARARCKIHQAILSGWSESLVVTVLDTNTFYILNVDLIPKNAGIIQINPNKNIYSPNEIVQLTAINKNGNGIKDGNIHIEAETGLLYGPIVVNGDENASQGKFISAPTGDSNPTGNPSNGRAEYSFSITDPGNYLIWGRIYAPSGGEDTFFFVVDADPDTLLWDIERPYNVWRWMKFKDRQLGEFRKYLAAGTHSLTLIKREVNTKIDKIIISKDLNFQPEDIEPLPLGDIVYNFDNWSGDLAGSENPAEIVMDGNKTVIANFTVDGDEVVTTPNTPAGPDTGVVGENLSFFSGGAISNFGYNVEYQFDWGDGSMSDWGDSTMMHTYNHADTMWVKARARSTGNTSIISDWSIAHKIVIVEKPILTYSLTILIDPENKGTVTVDPVKAEYAPGDTVVLYPVPAENYIFDHWSGDLTGTDNPDTVVMNGNKNIVAYFVTYSLSIIIDPVNKGAVTKSPDKLGYALGDTVVLYPLPIENYIFNHWSGDLIGNQNPDTIVINGNVNIVAHFAQFVENVSTPTKPVGPEIGIIGQSLNFTTGGANCNVGHEVEYQFDWGDGSLSVWGVKTRQHIFSYSDSMEIKARARCKINTSVVSSWSEAHFVFIATSFNHTLNISIDPSGSGSVNKTPYKLEYDHGEIVILSPLAASGYYFDQWSGDLTGSSNPASVIMDNNKNISATFKLISGLENSKKEIPQKFGLSQNYPNPFNPETNIQYQLAENCNVKITIFNVHGQKIYTLIDKPQIAGYYYSKWHAIDNTGNKVPSGVYLYKLKTEYFSQIKKMILIK